MQSTVPLRDAPECGFLDSLNAAQRAAVTVPLGNYLVLAGAGTGKTRVLTQRIAWLAMHEGFPVERNLAVTFTNKAAGEMRERVAALLPTGAKASHIGTFHGIAHRFLRAHWREAHLPERFTILDADDQKARVKAAVREAGIDPKRWPLRDVCECVNTWKGRGLRADRELNEETPLDRACAGVYAIYERACERDGAVDFTELLLRMQETLEDNVALRRHCQQLWPHILVDEFQDTNRMQYAIVTLLAGDTGKVFAVGDDDQSIYGWRGAEVENMKAFSRNASHVRVLRLEQNYRSTETILCAANAVIGHNTERLGKTLWTESGRGSPVYLYKAGDEVDEARFIARAAAQYVAHGNAAEDLAILYRTHAQSPVLERELASAGVKFHVYGGARYFSRMEVKDALAYLRLSVNPGSADDFERAVQRPGYGVGRRTVERIRDLARQTNTSALEAARTAVAGTIHLAPRQRAGLAAFVAVIDSLAALDPLLALAERVATTIERAGLFNYYADPSADGSESRTDNLRELVNVAARFCRTSDDVAAGLSDTEAFLAHVTLDAEHADDDNGKSGVQMMTLHSAKGLEFPVVFMPGMEDGLFPSSAAGGDDKKMEEERRLAYVGITRARATLMLLCATKRHRYGKLEQMPPSRFLGELPPELVRDAAASVPSWPSAPTAPRGRGARLPPTLTAAAA